MWCQESAAGALRVGGMELTPRPPCSVGPRGLCWKGGCQNGRDLRRHPRASQGSDGSVHPICSEWVRREPLDITHFICSGHGTRHPPPAPATPGSGPEGGKLNLPSSTPPGKADLPARPHLTSTVRGGAQGHSWDLEPTAERPQKSQVTRMERALFSLLTEGRDFILSVV